MSFINGSLVQVWSCMELSRVVTSGVKGSFNYLNAAIFACIYVIKRYGLKWNMQVNEAV